MADNNWEKVGTDATETWDFITDKELVGVLLDKEENVGPNNSMMYRIQTESGVELGVWGNTVLDGKFKKIEVGDEVKIMYMGKQRSPKTNREYHSFEVYHRKPPMTKI